MKYLNSHPRPHYIRIYVYVQLLYYFAFIDLHLHIAQLFSIRDASPDRPRAVRKRGCGCDEQATHRGSQEPFPRFGFLAPLTLLLRFVLLVFYVWGPQEQFRTFLAVCIIPTFVHVASRLLKVPQQCQTLDDGQARAKRYGLLHYSFRMLEVCDAKLGPSRRGANQDLASCFLWGEELRVRDCLLRIMFTTAAQ